MIEIDAAVLESNGAAKLTPLSFLDIKADPEKNRSKEERHVRCAVEAKCTALEYCDGLRDQLQYASSEDLDELVRLVNCGSKNGRQMVCCPPAENTSLLPDEATCGVEYRDRIYGGERADIDEHPWIALLIYEIRKGVKWVKNGGALISSRYVLTAGHCVVSRNYTVGSQSYSGLPQAKMKIMNDIELLPLLRPTQAKLKSEASMPYKRKYADQVRLGEWDATTSKECYKNKCNDPSIDVPIEKIIRHKQYHTEKEKFNDIALLRLAQKVQFTDFIRPICLPLKGDLRRADWEGHVLESAGWGSVRQDAKGNSTVKMKVQVPVYNHTKCKELFAKVYGRRIIKKQMCAGLGNGKSSCHGDSGTPLMARSPKTGNWVAVGIVSYGAKHKCGSEGMPTIYTRVGAYIKWILSNLEP